ncbi:uncharacterized protein LOC117175177 isoform X3 [Belonocnema kinseyi]|uniref:uncharacterized protein LOC117175177 isoform X3 n=1 Tax=Belonocnema kinseyi TaxID=2817044 RepID=UPI00143DF074|nr:uncharacterized protein LOC117175177 isoform X3 [Belonocnema kinseyi]
MKGAKYSKVLDDLAENLEEVLRTAKENDLSHLIEPLQETISKVKELNRGREVECELAGECNSEDCNLHMACSCNDWGPDKLGPDGKWICEICNSACFCDQIWSSCTHLPKTEPVKISHDETNTIKDIFQMNKNSNQSIQKNSAECISCFCSASSKTENQNKRNKKKSQINELASKIVSDSSKENVNEDKTNKKILNLSDCETKFLSGQISGSFTHFSKKEPVKKSLDEANTIKDILLIKPDSRRSFQQNSSAKCDPCVCSASRKNKDQNTRNEQISPKNASASKITSNPSKENENEDRTNGKTLNQSASGTKCNTNKIDHVAILIRNIEYFSVSKNNESDIDIKINRKLNKPCEKKVSVLYEKKQKSKGKMYSEQVRAESLNTEAKYAKKSKCVSCECTYNEEGNKIKTKECRAASERNKKLMASLEKENNARIEDKNTEVQTQVAKAVEIKISRFNNDSSTKGLTFEEKRKCDIVICNSSSIGLLKDSNDQRCWDEMKDVPLFQAAEKERRRAQQISKCLEKRIKNVPDKYASSRSVQSSQESCPNFPPRRETLEKPEKPLKCSEIAGLGGVQKCDEPTRNSRKIEPPYNRCQQEMKKPRDTEKCLPGSEGVERENESTHNFFNFSEIADQSDEPTRNSRRTKLHCNRCPQGIKKPDDTEEFSLGAEEVKKECETSHSFMSCTKIEDRGTVQSSEKEKRENEILHGLMKCSEIGDRDADQKSDEPTENWIKMKPPCNRSLREMNKPRDTERYSPDSKKVKGENESQHNFFNCSKIADQSGGHPTENSAGIRRQKMQEKYTFPEEERREEISTMTEGKIVDNNFKYYPCNDRNATTSIEKQCPCGCGYFLQGAPANRPCPCNNSLKVPHQEEEIESKKILPKSRKSDCEGCCEWCSSQ